VNLTRTEAEELECTLLVAHAALGRVKQDCLNAMRSTQPGSPEESGLMNRATQLHAHQETCNDFLKRIETAYPSNAKVEPHA